MATSPGIKRTIIAFLSILFHGVIIIAFGRKGETQMPGN